MIKNFLNTPVQTLEGSHEGKGQYQLYEIWGSEDFNSQVDFIDRVVIPAGSTVGLHKHGNNEEMYVILEGEGEMTLDGKTSKITKGDMILNKSGGEHGLVNYSDKEIDILVIQISL